MDRRIFLGLSLAALAAATVAPAAEAAALQCVPYARRISGVAIRGDAWTWWGSAAGVYPRGQTPRLGAVLVFKSIPSMPRGHVAVVSRIVDARTIEVDHANWDPGKVTRGAKVIDVSARNDWSEVRVEHRPGVMGKRRNPVYGFIYGGERASTFQVAERRPRGSRVPADFE